MRLGRIESWRPPLWLAVAAMLLFTLAGSIAAARADDGIPVRTGIADDGTLIYTDDEPPLDESTPPDEVIDDGLSGVTEEAAPEPPPELGGSTDYAAAVAAVGGLPSCRSYTVSGKYGYIAVQTSPTGYVQWGTSMYRWLDNYGWWIADTYVNGRRTTHMSQSYPPHGSLPPSVAPPGSVFSIYMAHTFLSFSWFRISVVLVYGNLTCIVP
jgi:hypothetical protein